MRCNRWGQFAGKTGLKYANNTSRTAREITKRTNSNVYGSTKGSAYFAPIKPVLQRSTKTRGATAAISLFFIAWFVSLSNQADGLEPMPGIPTKGADNTGTRDKAPYKQSGVKPCLHVPVKYNRTVNSRMIRAGFKLFNKALIGHDQHKEDDNRKCNRSRIVPD